MSDSTAAGGGDPALAISIGAVVKRSFAIFFANLVPFGVLALILLLPNLFFNFALLSPVGVGIGGVQILIYIGLYLVLYYLLMGTLVYGTVAQMRGQPASMGLIVSRGLASLLPLVVIAVATVVATLIGFVLLIVPGIFLIVVLSVTIPAYVVERPGIVNSFRRSIELTKGNRWRVLGVLVVLVVIFAVIGFVVSFVTNILAAIGLGVTFGVIANYIVSALTTAVGAVAAAVLYHDLRIAKEGVSTDQIAAVFD